jgi:hypothetical protein
MVPWRPFCITHNATNNKDTAVPVDLMSKSAACRVVVLARRSTLDSTVRNFNATVPGPTAVTAVAVKHIGFIGPTAAPGSAPGLFHFGSHRIPLVRELTTQSVLQLVYVVREARPWFLAKRKVHRNDRFQRHGPAILTLRFTRSTVALDLVVDGLSRAGIVAHLVVATAIQFDRLAGMENIVIVGNDPLKGHGTIERSDLTAPSAARTEISLANNVPVLFVDLLVRLDDQEATLHRLVLDGRLDHVIIIRKGRIDNTGNILVRKHGQRRRIVDGIAQHQVENRVERFQDEYIEIQVHDKGIFGQGVGFQLDQFLFSTTPVGGNLGPQIFALNVRDGHGRVAAQELVAQILQWQGARFSLWMIDADHFVLVPLSIPMDRMFQHRRAFGDGIAAATRHRHGKSDRQGLVRIIVHRESFFSSRSRSIGRRATIRLLLWWRNLHAGTTATGPHTHGRNIIVKQRSLERPKQSCANKGSHQAIDRNQ